MKVLMMDCFFRIYACNFINKGLGEKSFHGNVEEILRSATLQNIYGQLFLV